MSQSLIFAPLSSADQLALPSGDLIAPKISHELLTESIKAGSSQKIKATVTDNVGIKAVTLFYRNVGAEEYKRIQMNQVEGTNEFVATLGFGDIVEPGVEYYIQAIDLAGNALLHGYSFSPLNIAVITDASAPDSGTAKSETPPVETAKKEEALGEKKTNKWLWIGLGVLAVGVVAAVAGGGDDGEPAAKPTTGTVTLSAPVPDN